MSLSCARCFIKRRVKIIGAGFSGLAAAFWLRQQGFEQISIFDRAPAEGGLLSTHVPSPELGLVESAANAFLANSEVYEMSQTIGVPLLPTLKESRVRLIWRNGRVHRWPLGTIETAALGLKLAKSLGRFRPKKHESLDLWAQRELSPATAKFLVSPAFQGVYGTQAKNLNAQLILSAIRNFKSQGKAPIKGSVSPENGMGAFQKGLRAYLEKSGCEILFQKEVFGLGDFKRSKEEIIVVATSLFDAAKLMADTDAALAESMQKIPSVGLATATVFYRPEARHQRAFGCLFPQGEGVEALGVLFNNFIFAGRGPALSETWIYGGKYAESDSQALLAQQRRDRTRLAGKEIEPLGAECHFWPRALPLYSWELRDLLNSKRLESFADQNIFFIGNYLGAMGLGKIAVQARLLAERIKKTEAT